MTVNRRTFMTISAAFAAAGYANWALAEDDGVKKISDPNQRQ